MSTRWIVWGMGGHGSVVAELVGATGAVVAGFADRDPAGPASVDEVRLLDILSSGLPLPLDADHLALGIGDNAARLSAWQSIPAELAPPLIHPAAW
ncbi:MAG TPA: hypothetical protein PLL69_11235, partial [Gemmatimonadales bacterium]|nr:hypothetical protein [Gemmatimonadales bacterium]